MDWAFLGRGLVIGLSIAAPVGPIGVLCIRRTLSDARAAGLVSGLAAAARDDGSAAVLVAGVFTGSALWWFILSGIASSVRGRMRPGSLRWVSLAAGVIITSFGILALLSLR